MAKKKTPKTQKPLSVPPVSTVASISKSLNKKKSGFKLPTPQVDRRGPDRMSDAHVTDIKNTVADLKTLFWIMVLVTFLNAWACFNLDSIVALITAVFSFTITAELSIMIHKLSKKIKFKRK